MVEDAQAKKPYGKRRSNVSTTSEAAEVLGLSESRVRSLALEGRIAGAQLVDGKWQIPENPVVGSKPPKPSSVIDLGKGEWPFSEASGEFDDQRETLTEHYIVALETFMRYYKGMAWDQHDENDRDWHQVCLELTRLEGVAQYVGQLLGRPKV